jgi:hypothetical protein
VIDISACCGNAKAQSPVLLSDDPHQCPWVDDRRRKMTMFKLLGSAAILSALIATPALAQHMIDEPGMYAFYHPNGDLGIGSARPANAMAAMPFRSNGDVAGLRMQSNPVLPRRTKAIKSY